MEFSRERIFPGSNGPGKKTLQEAIFLAINLSGKETLLSLQQLWDHPLSLLGRRSMSHRELNSG